MIRAGGDPQKQSPAASLEEEAVALLIRRSRRLAELHPAAVNPPGPRCARGEPNPLTPPDADRQCFPWRTSQRGLAAFGGKSMEQPIGRPRGDVSCDRFCRGGGNGSFPAAIGAAGLRNQNMTVPPGRKIRGPRGAILHRHPGLDFKTTPPMRGPVEPELSRATEQHAHGTMPPAGAGGKSSSVHPCGRHLRRGEGCVRAARPSRSPCRRRKRDLKPRLIRDGTHRSCVTVHHGDATAPGERRNMVVTPAIPHT